MSSAHPNRILPECDLCSRRANRLKYALHLLACVRKSYPEDSSLSDGFAVAAAQRYVDEVLWSHPEHPLVSSSEADSTRSSGREIIHKGLHTKRRNSGSHKVVPIANRNRMQIPTALKQHRIQRTNRRRAQKVTKLLLLRMRLP